MPDKVQGDVWSQLKAAFRSACSRRTAGDQAGAVSVLRDEVPGLVAAWAKTSDLNPAEKKQRLKSLFEEESDRAEELAAISALYEEKLESMLSSQVAQRVLDEIRPELEQLVCDRMAKQPPSQGGARHGQAFLPTGAEDELASEQEAIEEPEPEVVPEPVSEMPPVEAEDELASEQEAIEEPEPEVVPEPVAEMPPVEAEDELASEQEAIEEPEPEVVPEPVAEMPPSEDHLQPNTVSSLDALPEPIEGVAPPAAAESVESVAPEVQMTSDSESQHLPEEIEELPESSAEEGETEDKESLGGISFDDIEGLIDRILDETQ